METTLFSTDSLAWKIGGALLGYIVLSTLLTYLSPKSRYLRSLDWVGTEQQWTGKLRATLSSVKHTRQMLLHGYDRFSKNGKAFALPNFGSHPIMILPPEDFKEVLQKSDDDVDILESLREATATHWTGAHDVSARPFHIDVVRHQLTRELHLLTEDIHEELVLGFEDQWRATQDWTTVSILSSVSRIVSRAANRVFSGAELCRNLDFIDATRVYGEKAFIAGAVMSMLPRILHPIAAPIIKWQCGKSIQTCKEYAEPIIAKRIQEFLSGEKREPQHDALDWIIEQALKTKDPLEIDPDKLCRRIMRLNLAAIHTTSITSSNALLDLYSSPRAEEFVAALREECEQVLAANNGRWTKTAVNSLKKVDSAIKESMRMTTLGMIGVARVISKKPGLTLSSGLAIPAGVRVTPAITAIHSDARYYDRPEEYDPFRFSASAQDGEGSEKRSQGLTTTSMQFLSFGHGRHACPGRFFASQEMKIFLAHVVMNYDVKLPGERVKNFEFKAGSVPDPSSSLQIRLRQT